jgi:serine/threonine protein kinase
MTTISDNTEQQVLTRTCPACQQNIDRSDLVFCTHCQHLLPNPPALENRYLIDHSLGEGSFGHTYLALDIRTRKPVAIKRVMRRPYQTDSSGATPRFFDRELSLLAELNTPGHPNIPEVLDTFTDGAADYLVMKYVTGKTLRKRLEELSPLAWPDVSRILEQTLSALAYMHSLPEPVVHGDIKPNNIIEDDTGRLFLVDFGTARRQTADGNWTTESGTVSGTPGFASWDQWRGGPSPAGDIYSAGMMAYVLLAQREDYEQLLQANSVQRFTPHAGLEPADVAKLDVNEPIRNMLLAACTTEPGERPTADDWLHSLLGLDQTQDSGRPIPAARPLFFPDGEGAATEVEFVAIADRKRNIAIEYLYKDDILPSWLEGQCFRADLAQVVRTLRTDNPDRHEAFEFVLQVLDPDRPPAQLIFTPESIELKRSFLTRGVSGSFALTNNSPSYARVSLETSLKGMSVSPTRMTLEPHTRQTVVLTAPARVADRRTRLGSLKVTIARLAGPYVEPWPVSAPKTPWWFAIREIAMALVAVVSGLWIWSAVQYWLPCTLARGIAHCPLPPFPPPALLLLLHR